MSGQLQEILNRITGKKKEQTSLLPFFDVMREYGCADLILGKEYEITDSNGEVVYRIKQKPLSLRQVQELAKGLNELRRQEAEALEKAQRKTR